MADLEININLARAMGWKFYSKENPPIKKNVGISVTQAGLFAWDNDYPFFLWNDIVYPSSTSVSPCEFDNESGKSLLLLLC